MQPTLKNRSRTKTEVVYYVADLDAAPLTGKSTMFACSPPFLPLVTLGVAVEPRQYIADQLLATADVIRAAPADRICPPSREPRRQ